jgi:nucleotide-binding universal stress UspA family protein
MIKSILCPVDRSPNSLQAFGYAIALARWQGARLNLLEVLEGADAGSVPGDAQAELEQDLRRVLTARRASDVRVKIAMREGHVVEEILAHAKVSRADLVVIGTHGRRGVQRLVLGSVAERVLRLATCPVLTVRSGVRVARRGRSPFATILVATDFSAEATRAVAYATRLAKQANAKLIVIHAVEWPFGDAVTTGAVAALRRNLESSARDELSRLLTRPRSGGSDAQAVVAVGKASAAIIAAARARGADLIVMGISGRGATDAALLGSTTHQVIREGTWPVLTVRTLTP